MILGFFKCPKQGYNDVETLPNFIKRNNATKGEKKEREERTQVLEQKKTQTKGQTTKRKGNKSCSQSSPTHKKHQKVMLEKLDKNTQYCGSFLNVCI
jgi:predicted 2-oxoglutarate/Fe(II)-dependent dioxygenase YbiX